MSVSARKRFEILKRDGFACHYCGRRAPAAMLHVDHIVARANGGTDDEDNLITACIRCNLGKHTSEVITPDEGLHIWAHDEEYAIMFMLALVTGLELERIQGGELTSGEWQQIQAAAQRLWEAPIKMWTPGSA